MPLKKVNSKMFEMRKSPINWVLHLIAGIVIIYALWQHNIILIIIGALIAIAGRIIQALSHKKGIKKRKRK